MGKSPTCTVGTSGGSQPLSFTGSTQVPAADKTIELWMYAPKYNQVIRMGSSECSWMGFFFLIEFDFSQKANSLSLWFDESEKQHQSVTGDQVTLMPFLTPPRSQGISARRANLPF